MSLLPVGISGEEAGYQIERSLRFNSADSAYLNRTPGSAGDRKTWTWSGWVKRSALGSQTFLFNADNGSANSVAIDFFNEQLRIYFVGGTYQVATTQVFRDPSAWYHLLFSVDTTQATSSNRVKLYVNGSQVTALSTASYPIQNLDTAVNNTVVHNLGFNGVSNYFNGYLTEINFIDGQALTPSSFGETDTDTGVWKPKKYTGSYSGNSFYLNFSDNSGTTSTTLGKDSSGLGNNWTPNNFSVTAGAGNDSLVDTPTPYGTDTGVGGEVRGNYATLNPLDNGGNTVSNGNLVVTTATGFDLIRSTMFVSSGKWYWEITCDDCGEGYVGISSAAESLAQRGAETANSATIRTTNGDLRTNATNSAYGSAVADGNVMMFALDMDAGKFWAGKSGTWFNSGDPAAGTNAGKTGLTVAVSPSISVYDNEDYTANFGQRPFAYTAPSGFKALCTQNLPTPTIIQGNDYFNTILYTGTGSSNARTGVGFQPDFVWIKGRSGATDHGLYDAVRGVQKQLETNNTGAETTETTGLTAFGSDGFTVGALAQLNTSSATYVAWNWKANGAGSTNTAGTITSTVSVNTTSGFSIVTYTGTGSAATVGHGLGVAPSMVIVKKRSTTGNWATWHTGLTGGSPEDRLIYLNLTDAQTTVTDYWGTNGMTSTTFGIWNTGGDNNQSGQTFVAYCFANVSGYSQAFSFSGNGSTDGSFVFLGFRPAFVLIKRTDTTSNWTILDFQREGYNVDNDPLYPNLANAEGTTDLADLLSNGFKLRTTDASVNASGGTYIGFAVAQNPFKHSLAR